jgi:hypothetical protein
MEAKLIALDTTSVEVVWRHELLMDLWVDEKTYSSYFYEL